MEQNIKLNDGELAVVLGEASIIMNVNTAFELVEKAKSFTGCANEEKQEVNDDNDADLCEEIINDIDDIMENIEDEDELNEEYVDEYKEEKQKQKEQEDRKKYETVPVVCFTFDLELAKRKNDIIAGIGDFQGRCDSIFKATDWYYIGSKAIEHTINTWSSFKNETTIDFDKFYSSTDEEGKPRKWWTAKCDGIDYPPMDGFKRLVFFRADEIPTFILTRKPKYKTYEGIVLP